MKRRNYIVVMMMSLLLGSCSSEDILSVPNGNGRIRFDVGVSQSEEVMEMPINTTPMTCGNDTLYAHSAALRSIELHNDVTSKTRGTEVDGSTFYDKFGLYGYVYDSDKTWTGIGSSLQPTIINENIANGSTWSSSSYLPGKTKKMAFFAYAPYTTTGLNVTNGTGAPQLTYTINSNVNDQVDLLVANKVDVAGNASSVELDFKHALTAVKFAVGTITGFTKITKIKISGVKNSGTLSLDGDNWSLSESTTDNYTIEKEINLSTTGDITGSSNDLMFLMPQTLPSGAMLEVTMTNNIGTATFSTPLSGEWKKGYTVKYTLSVNRVAGDFHFEVTPSTTSIPKEGGEFELKVKSYYQFTNDDTKVPIPWSGKYKMGNNEYILSGDGSVNDDIRKISVPANNSTLTHTVTLRANPSKGTTAKPWNLSNSQGEAKVENTANCYVVNSKGTYSIPLVYGCGIKNGEYNTKSYESSTFVNHAGNHITTPYIFNMVTADGAKLVWQDVQNMITVNSELGDNGHSLIFTIGDNIAQGNAVVAATANGVVVWSWHIWVTDTPLLTYTYDSYKFLNMPLGFVDSEESITGKARNINISLSQFMGEVTKQLTMPQVGKAATNGSALFYQWGRKDPFMKSGSAKGSGPVTQSVAIQNPNTFYKVSNGDWSSKNDNGYDYWNVGNTGNSTSQAVTKSIYDPSPVGYKLPPCIAFSSLGIGKAGFTLNGKGYLNTSNNDFWQMFGYLINSSGSLSSEGTYGYCWSASPSSSTHGYLLYFLSDSRVNTQSSSFRAFGFSVRPVSE